MEFAESDPWKDWVPGVLSKAQVTSLCVRGVINIEGVGQREAEIKQHLDDHLDDSSLDLTLSDQAYRMTKGAVKPWGKTRYLSVVTNRGLAEPMSSNDEGEYVLRPNQTYLFKLREDIRDLGGNEIYGRATTRSSVGRVDVLVRLIVDGMNKYEGFYAGGEPRPGDMFVEVTPISFRVKVKKGISLSQLRLFYCRPYGCEVDEPEAFNSFIKNPHGSGSDGTLSVNLNPVEGSESVVAFKSRDREVSEPVPLWKVENPPDPDKFFEAVSVDHRGRLKIEKDAFYILRSKERLSIPKGIAVYCKPIDETVGEMRIHYAGFIHPGFGNDGDTPLIFEVRGHDLDVSLRDGEKMAQLKFYRMSKDAGGPFESSYDGQVLELSKFFNKEHDLISV